MFFFVPHYGRERNTIRFLRLLNILRKSNEKRFISCDRFINYNKLSMEFNQFSLILIRRFERKTNSKTVAFVYTCRKTVFLLRLFISFPFIVPGVIVLHFKWAYYLKFTSFLLREIACNYLYFR